MTNLESTHESLTLRNIDRATEKSDTVFRPRTASLVALKIGSVNVKCGTSGCFPGVPPISPARSTKSIAGNSRQLVIALLLNGTKLGGPGKDIKDKALIASTNAPPMIRPRGEAANIGPNRYWPAANAISEIISIVAGNIVEDVG